MSLVLQHIHYQDTVWRREGGRNVPSAAAHTLPVHCVEERRREGGMFLMLQHIHYQDTVWRREGGREECS